MSGKIPLPKSYCYIKVFYFGTQYRGLQRQSNANTIEEEMIKALRLKRYIPDESYKGQIPVYNAGRTDSGVHARAMVFAFLNFNDYIHPIELNKALPDDICVWASSIIHNEAELLDIYTKLIQQNTESQPQSNDLPLVNGNSEDISDASSQEIPNANLQEQSPLPLEVDNWDNILHEMKQPRFNALYRHYKYYLYNTNQRLNTDLMREAAQKFIGRHNFKNFCKDEGKRETIRTIDSIEITQSGDLLTFEFKAKSFLWHQIRKIMGTIIRIGYASWPVEYIDRLFDVENEKELVYKVHTAPGENLILWNVEYPPSIVFMICEKSVKKLINQLDKLYSRIAVKSELMSSVRKSLSEEK